MSQPPPVYPRILLKLSGEGLTGQEPFGIDPTCLARISEEIGGLLHLGVQVGLVTGGGNLFRGAELSAAGLDRVTGDHMGMLATVMNSLALQDALQRAGIASLVMSSIPMSGIAEHYDRKRAMQSLAAGQVVILAGGTGNPLFTTDSAACLRAIELQASLMLKATQVDGVYSADPRLVPNAGRYRLLTCDEVLEKQLGVMDLTAICLARDHSLPICVFAMEKDGALRKIVTGEDEGTLIVDSETAKTIRRQVKSA